MTGRFYGLGVGPGAPDLLTLRAHRVLTRVPVVVYPACKPGASSYAWRIVREFVPGGTRRLAQVFPMSRDWASLIPVWRQNAEEIAQELRAGHDVAFITEGDPMLFSTFLHVWELLREVAPEVEVEIVPGVSSMCAAAGLTGIPLGQGDQRVALIPATWHEDDLTDALQRWDVVVLMKVARVLPKVIDLLRSLGRLEQAALVSRGSAEQQLVTRDLERYRDRRLNYLTTVLVGRPLGFVESLLAESAAGEPEDEPNDKETT
ncbi:precorrin-2 C(20)-methyltransferase [Myxococcota bacterium]|nr:precorrin-2 C(20)-methyltransferase [Myxococcota bacterium]